MRLPILLVLSLAACGGETGAMLTLSAAEMPSPTRVEIVLASADPQTITEVADQRVSPATTAEGKARYYRQRATGGVVASVSKLDGFTVRLEPDPTIAADEAFIPFVLAYDGDKLVAIGAYEDAAGDPAPVTIKTGMVAKYTVKMQAVKPASPTAPILAGEVDVVSCRPNDPWRSGLAWQPPTGQQRRLLLPDLAKDPGATDATMRATDLDCDRHEAGNNDCDDLRASFHEGHAEACDGLDSNCDGARFSVVDCTFPSGGQACGSTMGVSMCDELMPTSAASTCAIDPACACAGPNGTTIGCTRCMMDFMTTSDPAEQEPCSPGVGFVKLELCATMSCEVEVVSTTGGVEATIGSAQLGPFSARLLNVHQGVYLHAKHDKVIAQAGESFGAVYLAVARIGRTDLVGIDIELSQGMNACTMLGNGLATMTCTP